MRILQVCPYDLARPGGVQRHVLDLSRALTHAGHEVVIVAPASPRSGTNPPPAEETSVLHVGTARSWRLHGTSFEISHASTAQLLILSDEHRRMPFDVAHFHTLWTPIMPWQVFRKMSPLVKRRIATFHDTPPPTLSGSIARGLFKILSRRLSKQLDAMIAVSDSPAAHLRPLPHCPLLTLPPCIELAAYRAVPEGTPAGHSLRLLFVGRLEPRKGVLVLIEAFAQLCRRHASAELVICGDGEQSELARELVSALGIARSVKFAGALADEEKRRLFSAADIFCAPSPYGESYGLVIAEAMAAGLPVVAAANAGYRTLLTGDGAIGLVVPGDSATLAAKLAEFADSPELRQRLSAWGRAASLSSDVTARLDEFIAIYADAPARS